MRHIWLDDADRLSEDFEQITAAHSSHPRQTSNEDQQCGGLVYSSSTSFLSPSLLPVTASSHFSRVARPVHCHPAQVPNKGSSGSQQRSGFQLRKLTKILNRWTLKCWTSSIRCLSVLREHTLVPLQGGLQQWVLSKVTLKVTAPERLWSLTSLMAVNPAALMAVTVRLTSPLTLTRVLVSVPAGKHSSSGGEHRHARRLPIRKD